MSFSYSRSETPALGGEFVPVEWFHFEVALDTTFKPWTSPALAFGADAE